jgi:SAM-dependent methyltransferase
LASINTIDVIKKLIKKLKSIRDSNEKLLAEGEKGINQVGHRAYVGGFWEEIGKLQFDFLVANGLKPSDVFMDIACGSLRAGVHIIPYLQPGHYLGIDKEKSLIDSGLKKELNEEMIAAKLPEFVISNNFEFNKFTKVPNFAIAQSLFTHLPPRLIHLCFKNLKNHFQENGVFYATYFITSKSVKNPNKPHDHGIFKYTWEEVNIFGTANGWDVEIIGDWNHPRNQQIVKYTIANTN